MSEAYAVLDDDRRKNAGEVVVEQENGQVSIMRSVSEIGYDLATTTDPNAALNEKKAWIIDPIHPFMQKWDVFITILLVYTALVTPFSVSFMGNATGLMFFMDKFVDLGFLIDMFINFFLGFKDDEGIMQWRHSKIVKKYLSSWFSIDFLSILPWDMAEDVIGSDGLDSLKILKILRLFRLLKLLRILRSGRILKRIQTSMGISFASVTLIKLLSITLLVIHWQACLWNIIPSLEADDATTWISENEAESWDAASLYIAALEYSLCVLPMGPSDFGPKNPIERGISIFFMVVGGSVYAYAIGNVCDVISSLDAASTEYRQSVDMLNKCLAENNCPQEMRIDARAYFLHCRDLFRRRYFRKLLLQMSPSLKGQVVHTINGKWIAKISFFNADHVEERYAFATAISTALHPHAYPPGERLFVPGDLCDKLFIVSKGLCGHAGRVVSNSSSKSFFGEDIVAALVTKDYRRDTAAQTLTYLDVQVLEQADLFKILRNSTFPETRKLIRKAAIRMALKRTILSTLRMYRAWLGLSGKMSRTDADKFLQHQKELREEKLRHSPSAANRHDAWTKRPLTPIKAPVPEKEQPNMLEWWASKTREADEERAIFGGYYDEFKVKRDKARAACENNVATDTRWTDLDSRLDAVNTCIDGLANSWVRNLPQMVERAKQIRAASHVAVEGDGEESETGEQSAAIAPAPMQGEGGQATPLELADVTD